MKKILSTVLAVLLIVSLLPHLTVSAATTLIWPVPGHKTLSQGYHSGNAIDISDGSIAGATVIAAIGGTVKKIFLCQTQHPGNYGDCGGFGTGLVISGDDGRTYSYAHMMPGSIPSSVYFGARVSAGQVIGKVGTSGNSYGYHLHFGISNTNNYWDPGPNPANESYTNQITSLKVLESVTCKFKIVIPANYKLELYFNETDATPTTERWINPRVEPYTLSCDKKVTLSDGSIRYHFTSGDGYSVFFKYNSSCMTITSSHSWGEWENRTLCTEISTVKRVCSICGAKETKTLPATNHNFGKYVYNNDATAVKDGTMTRSCSTCGKKETITATGTKWTNPFKDVKSSEYFYTPVLWAVAKNVTYGTSANTFSPGNACTRGQIVTFLWKVAGSPAPKGTSNPFKDVNSSHYYYKAVLWATEKGITSGTSANTFSPGNACTRGQIVTFLWKVAGSPAPKGMSNIFMDVNSNQYYYKAVLWAVENGITSGTSANTFTPSDVCTRGQSVTFLYKSKN